MDRVKDQEVDDAIDILGRFVRDSLDVNAKDVPGVDDVRAAIGTLIAANIFNADDYEIKNLLRVSESKKGVSHIDLSSRLKNLVPHAKQMWELAKYRAINGWPENEDPFSDM